ncbi:MAG TPA: ribosome maturation factor RimP [Acidimicrobiales bacterium]
MSVADRVRDLVLPILAERELDLYDVELAGGVLRVVVDRRGGLGLDALSDATRAVSRALDQADPIPGRYTLEVTSPGVERTLRTPQHFERAVGETVKIKTTPGAASDRRLEGVLAAADPTGIAVTVGVDDAGEPEVRRLAYDDIVRARTVFEWGTGARTPAPGARSGPGRAAAGTSDERERRS